MSGKYAIAPEPKPDTEALTTEMTADLFGSQAAVKVKELSEEEEEAEDLAYAEAALARVTSRLGDAAGELSEFAADLRSAGDDPQQLRAAEQVLDQIQSVEDILQRIFRRRRARQNPGDGFSVVAQVSALVSDAETDTDRWPGTGPDPSGPPPKPPRRSPWKVALAHIKDALPHIWAFISRLITPVQWTASGNVGTGIFGIASASITVTFGKPD
jgi:hypothetical protein